MYEKIDSHLLANLQVNYKMQKKIKPCIFMLLKKTNICVSDFVVNPTSYTAILNDRIAVSAKSMFKNIPDST